MRKKKIQILMIHGGTTFKSRKDYFKYLKTRMISLEKPKSWSGEYLQNKLGNRYQIIRPNMPSAVNANYEAWKIYFERHLKLLGRNFILIGNSLGGIFLAKYLSENALSNKALSVYLICPPYDNTLPGEDLVGGFKLKSDLSLIEKNAKNVYLLFSKDDDVVPVSHAEKFRKKLTNSKIMIFESKNGHFKISSFAEIVSMIKKDVKSK